MTWAARCADDRRAPDSNRVATFAVESIENSERTSGGLGHISLSCLSLDVAATPLIEATLTFLQISSFLMLAFDSSRSERHTEEAPPVRRRRRYQRGRNDHVTATVDDANERRA